MATQASPRHGETAGHAHWQGRVDDAMWAGQRMAGWRLNLDKALVVVGRAGGRAGIGRIRLRQIADASAEAWVALVRESWIRSIVIRTDGWISAAEESDTITR